MPGRSRDGLTVLALVMSRWLDGEDEVERRLRRSIPGGSRRRDDH
jgi:hypothetical protein